MGALNAAPAFCCFTSIAKGEWDLLILQMGITEAQVRTDNIVDDLILGALTHRLALKSLRGVLIVLMKYRCTVKLKKCSFLKTRTKFVGINILAEGNSPSQQKIVEMKKLEQPRTFRDLIMVVGMFGFYYQFIPFFEAKIELF